MSAGLNALCALFCLIALTLFIVALVGHSCSQSVIRDTYWVYAGDGANDYFGTRCSFVETVGPTSPVINYEATECVGDYCDTCAAFGNTAFGLNIVAIAFTTISLGLCWGAATQPNKDSSISNIVMSFLAFAASLIGTVLFMSRCYSEINNQFGTSVAQWGPGSVLSLVGLIFMGLVSLLQVIDVATMKEDALRAGPTTYAPSGSPGRVR